MTTSYLDTPPQNQLGGGPQDGNKVTVFYICQYDLGEPSRVSVTFNF